MKSTEPLIKPDRRNIMRDALACSFLFGLGLFNLIGYFLTWQDLLQQQELIDGINYYHAGVEEQAGKLESIPTPVSDLSSIIDELNHNHKGLWEKASLFLFASIFCLLSSLLFIVFFFIHKHRLPRTLSIVLQTAEMEGDANTDLIEHVSHKIRTPLNSISSSVEMLRSTGLNEHQIDTLDVLDSSMDAITVLITDVLDITTLEKNSLKLSEETISLNEFLWSLYRTLRPLAVANDLLLTFDWPNVENYGIKVDPLRLRQVLFNLLTNSINCNDQGLIKLEITAGQSHDDKIDFQFSVTGICIGLTSQQIESLNTVFRAVPGSKSDRPNFMDPGLFISSAIVRSMGGEMRLHYELGKGSSFAFSISLPFVYSSRESVSLCGSSVPDFVDEEQREPARLNSALIVDDIAINRKIIKSTLDRLGVVSHEAGCGQDAIKAVQSRSFDLILMDIKMPGIDGFETTRMIRFLDIDKQPVIIAISADVLNASKTMAEEAGMDAFISKPIKVEQFKNTLKRFFDMDKIGHPILKLRLS